MAKYEDMIRVTIALERDLRQKLRVLAATKGMATNALLKEWILEKIEELEKGKV
jgi:predicted DNA-binding protein